MKKRISKKAKKSVLKRWINFQKAQWNSIVWCGWMAICLSCMCFPVLAYPGQILLTSFAKSFLSAIPELANWTVRHFSVYGDDMFLIACADCGRILVLSYVFIAVIQLIYVFMLTYLKTEKKALKRVAN